MQREYYFCSSDGQGGNIIKRLGNNLTKEIFEEVKKDCLESLEYAVLGWTDQEMKDGRVNITGMLAPVIFFIPKTKEKMPICVWCGEELKKDSKAGYVHQDGNLYKGECFCENEKHSLIKNGNRICPTWREDHVALPKWDKTTHLNKIGGI